MNIFKNIRDGVDKLVAVTKAKFGAKNVEYTSKNEEPAKKLTYEHQVILNQLLKTIATCPMDDELKTILRWRIWGEKIDAFAPLKPEEIARILKTRVENVIRWEQDAKWNIEQFLDRTGIVSISEKFSRDNDLRKIMEPRKRIIV